MDLKTVPPEKRKEVMQRWRSLKARLDAMKREDYPSAKDWKAARLAVMVDEFGALGLPKPR